VKWIIVSCNYGRLGNRLHTHANILAWCIANDYNLTNISFKPYSHLFETQKYHYSYSYLKTWNLGFYLIKFNFISNYFERLILSKKWMQRLSFLFHYIEKDNGTTLEEHELDLIKSNKIIIIKAWDIRCQNSLKLVEEFVKKLLRPASYYIKPASNFINNLKKHYDCLVGIHARRGDYKTYLNGEHYYSWEKYKTWILEFREILKTAGYGNIGFVLCSDDKPPLSLLNEKNTHRADCKHYMEDLQCLTLCDYNIGPPSSFGTWVSWIGKVPRLILFNNTEIKSLEQFEVCETC
jgi:hypothetical protein